MTLLTHVAFASVLYLGGATLFGYKPLSHLGFRDGLQALLKNFDIAREQYQRQTGTQRFL